MEYTQRHYGEFLEGSLKGTGTSFEQGGAKRSKLNSYSQLATRMTSNTPYDFHISCTKTIQVESITP